MIADDGVRAREVANSSEDTLKHSEDVGMWKASETDCGVCVGKLCKCDMQLRPNKKTAWVAFLNHRLLREQGLYEVGGIIGGEARKRDNTGVWRQKKLGEVVGSKKKGV